MGATILNQEKHPGSLVAWSGAIDTEVPSEWAREEFEPQRIVTMTLHLAISLERKRGGGVKVNSRRGVICVAPSTDPGQDQPGGLVAMTASLELGAGPGNSVECSSLGNQPPPAAPGITFQSSYTQSSHLIKAVVFPTYSQTPCRYTSPKHTVQTHSSQDR